MKVTVTPVSAEKKPVEWRVSDPSVAAVEGGLITGLKSGETIVTAYTGEKTACCKVKVKGADSSEDSAEKNGEKRESSR